MHYELLQQMSLCTYAKLSPACAINMRSIMHMNMMVMFMISIIIMRMIMAIGTDVGNGDCNEYDDDENC